MTEPASCFSLDGKIALVTGGAGILGRHFCAGLADAGAQVAMVDLEEALERDKDKTCHPAITPFACDVSDPVSVNSCVTRVIKQFGKIDILHNNAATKTAEPRAFFTPFEQYSLETWREVMSVNIDGMFLMAQAVGHDMVARREGGVIVQTASIYGLLGPDNRLYEGSHYLEGAINTPAVYAASKAAVIGLTRWLATHWAQANIRVNCLVPGGVSSGQNTVFSQQYASRVPLGRMAMPDDIVPALLYLASEASRYMTGQVLTVDGGWTSW